MTIDEYEKALKKLKKDMPDVMNRLALREASFAVKRAVYYTTSDEPDSVNTGQYRWSFFYGKRGRIRVPREGEDRGDGSRARKRGKRYKIDVYNSAAHAIHIEYGFRSHFVPGHWEGKSFVYQPGDPEGGMYVGPPGGVVRGKFHLKRAMEDQKKTQNARTNRLFQKELKRRGL